MTTRLITLTRHLTRTRPFDGCPAGPRHRPGPIPPTRQGRRMQCAVCGTPFLSSRA